MDDSIEERRREILERLRNQQSPVRGLKATPGQRELITRLLRRAPSDTRRVVAEEMQGFVSIERAGEIIDMLRLSHQR